MDHIADYIIPILIAVFYLVTSGKKKKQQEAEKQRRLAQPPRAPAERAEKPPVIRNETITSQHVPQTQSTLSKRASTATPQKVSTASKSLTDRGISARIDGKKAYAIKSSPTTCRGVTLIRKMPSLQDAFVFHEIFNRYDDNPKF